MSRSDYVRAPIGLGLGGVQLHEKRNRSAVPGPFNLNMWTVSNAFTGDRIDLDLINVPHAEGAPVLDVERSINGGAWTSVGATSGVVPITGLTDGVEVVVQVRAVGAGGAGVPSNGKAVTPTWSAPVVAGTLTALDLPIGLPMNPIDLSAGFAVPGDPTLLSTTLSDRDAMLPDGLSVDPNSGLLSGTPGLASDATIVVRAINSGGFADSLFQLVVYGAPSIAGTLPDVLVDADVAMPTIEPRLAISVENDTDLSTVSWSLDPTSDALPSGVSIDTDTGAIQGIPTASGNHTIVVRASNAAGHATVSFMLSITAEDLALFDDPALTLIPTTEDPRNLLTWPASGTPVLTAQGGSLEGNVPVHLATSEVFARPEMSNISVNAGDELRASIVFEEPSADSVDLLRSTFKGGQEDYVDFVPSTGTLTHKSPGLIAAPSNLKVLPLSINRTRLEFDFVCNDASANFRFGVNGNSTNSSLGMIYHSVALARLSEASGGGGSPGGEGTALAESGGTGRVYVSASTGNNATAARNNQSKPFKTIAAAWSAAQAGDRIEIKAGTYSTGGVLNLGGKTLTNEHDRIALVAVDGDHSVTIQPGVALNSGQSAITVGTDYVTLFGLDVVANTSHSHNDGGAISAFGSDNTVSAQGNRISSGTQIGVEWWNTLDGLRIVNCRLRGTGIDGVKTARARNLLVHGCTFPADANFDESFCDAVSAINHVYEYCNAVCNSRGMLDGFTAKTGSVDIVWRGLDIDWRPNDTARPAISCGGVGNSATGRPPLPTPYRDASVKRGTVENCVIRGTAQRDLLLQGARECVLRDNHFLSDGSNTQRAWHHASSPSQDSSGAFDWDSGSNTFLRNTVNEKTGDATKKTLDNNFSAQEIGNVMGSGANANSLVAGVNGASIYAGLDTMLRGVSAATGTTPPEHQS